tara:strand:+ start:2446 stop:3405 length:960 start_codon:yes stop_codon:yes gene_type:complete
MSKGRTCPADYRLPASAFSAPASLQCDVLYVIGGLYGNRQALDAIERRLAAEPNAAAVFNGDAHWFDCDPAVFSDIEQRLQSHHPLRGNVETELARAGDDFGCGCAYPEQTNADTVERSNRIHQRLQQTVDSLPGMAEQLGNRPAWLVAEVAGERVAITHGDEQSLAGWQCGHAQLQSPARQQQLADWFAEQRIRVLACSHTCSPAALSTGDWAVINNGAAGMPNFSNGRYGLITRIAQTSSASAIYRAQVGSLIVEALPVNYDQSAFAAEFKRQWPDDSPAALSYWQRINKGTDMTPENACLSGFTLASTLCAMEVLS